jgi:single-strand DNA-binding protein
MATIQATIVGRLARDPELKTTNSGTSLVSVTIPVETGWGDNKLTTWWRVVMFGKRAEVVAKHLRKGKWATFTGEVSVREYTKKDGSKGASAEMKADSFSFVGNKSDSDDAGNRSQSSNKPNQQNTGRQGDVPFADDDIPF